MKPKLWPAVIFGSVLVAVTDLGCRTERVPPQYPAQNPDPNGAGPSPAPAYAPAVPAPYPNYPANVPAGPELPASTPSAPGTPPAQNAPPSAGPAQASTPRAVAGFACTSDADLQCPFARCLNSRCGGCTSSADCKPGSVCVSTPLGLACMPDVTGTANPAAPPAPPATPPAPTPGAPAPSIPVNDSFVAARSRCLQRTNEFRARVSAVALGNRSDQLACTDSQGARDATSKVPHSAFGQCNESAQNECPAFRGAPEAVVDRCLQMMFDEGPGQGPEHGHYTNLTNAAYRSLSCGFYVAADGSTWLVQNFYR